MEKVTGGSAKESEDRAEANRKMDLLAELKKAVSQLRQITDLYAQDDGVSELLINRLDALERKMMEELYEAVPLKKSTGR